MAPVLEDTLVKSLPYLHRWPYDWGVGESLISVSIIIINTMTVIINHFTLLCSIGGVQNQKVQGPWLPLTSFGGS
jgi:hypothetical protein